MLIFYLSVIDEKLYKRFLIFILPYFKSNNISINFKNTWLRVYNLYYVTMYTYIYIMYK